jgi:hypothetical protein
MAEEQAVVVYGTFLFARTASAIGDSSQIHKKHELKFSELLFFLLATCARCPNEH